MPLTVDVLLLMNRIPNPFVLLNELLLRLSILTKFFLHEKNAAHAKELLR
jgi:hypothetical protein